MPPNAHSGGGKKKNKKARSNASKANTTSNVVAAVVPQVEEVARNVEQRKEGIKAAILSREDEVVAETKPDVAVSSTEGKEEVEIKKIVKVDQDTEEEEEEELIVEEEQEVKEEVVEKELKDNECDLLKTEEKDLVDFSEETSTDPIYDCSEEIVASNEVALNTTPRVIEEVVEPDHEQENEIVDLIESMEKKSVLIDTTNGDKPSPPPRKPHPQTAKVEPNNLTSCASPKTAQFMTKERIVPRSRNSSISYNKGQVVRPSEPQATSIVGSVAGLMQEVYPMSQSQPTHLPTVEKADWVQMFSVEKAGNASERLDFLVVGLMRGYQIWSINANNECEEILSMRQGPIRACKILGNNFRGGKGRDVHAGQRPLMAVVDASDRQYCSVQIISLATGKQIHRLTFEEPICSLQTSDRYLVVVLSNSAYVYDFLDQFKEVRVIRTAEPCENCPPSLAITGQMVAFADKKLNFDIQSAGGLANEIEASSSSTQNQMMNAMNLVGRTMKSWTESVGATTGSTKIKSANGIVTVVDLARKVDDPSEQILCHWVAHVDAISHIAFSPDQRLVFTSDSTATVYNVFSILPHPISPTLAAVQHLYKLQRGNTPARVCSTNFSLDSRWLSVVTNHGTCHVFAICPFGGKPNQRTHGGKFVNKESRFHRSAGLTDSAEVTAATGQRGVSEASIYTKEHPVAAMNQIVTKCTSNSRVGPFPPPLCLNAIQKIKDNSTDSYSAWAVDLASAVGAASTTSQNTRKRLDVSKVSVLFSSKPQQNNVMSLLISRADATQGVVMMEYELRPRKQDASTSNEDIPRLNIVPLSVWNLQRTKNDADMHYPMPNGSPLVNLSAPSPRKPSSRRPGEEQWAPNVEIRTCQLPHRYIWQGPLFLFFHYNEQDSQKLVSPSTGSKSDSLGFKSIPVVVGESSSTAGTDVTLPSNATRIECGSYSSNNSFSLTNFESHYELTSRIADAVRDVVIDAPSTSTIVNDIDTIEEFFDTHSPSLARRGSSNSSSNKSLSLQQNGASTSTKTVTCAPPPRSQQKSPSPIPNDSDESNYDFPDDM